MVRPPWKARTTSSSSLPVKERLKTSAQPSGRACRGSWRASSERHVPRSVKQELARQSDRTAASGKPLFPTIVGYEETVIPQIENAILSGQDIVSSASAARPDADGAAARRPPGRSDSRPRGLGDSRRPLAPISPAGRGLVAEQGDKATHRVDPARPPLRREAGHADITIADLIGEVDPIKVARAAISPTKLTIHYGLCPARIAGSSPSTSCPTWPSASRWPAEHHGRARRADPRLQGAAALDLFVVASANPEGYTNRGRIITPLKDARLADPHALSAPRRRREAIMRPSARASARRHRDARPRVHEAGGGGADAPGAPRPEISQRPASLCAWHLQLRESPVERAQAGIS